MNEIECLICGVDISQNEDQIARTFKDDNGTIHLGNRIMLCERCFTRGKTLVIKERRDRRNAEKAIQS